MLFLLIAGHALADFPLQNDAMATCKCRRASLPLQQAVPWYYWMTAHALVHGFVVAVIIGWWMDNKLLGVLFGIMEFFVHWILDTLKCEGATSIHTDQAMHILCKMAWAVMIAKGITFIS